jgi:hypothetical protein
VYNILWQVIAVETDKPQFFQDCNLFFRHIIAVGHDDSQFFSGM